MDPEKLVSTKKCPMFLYTTLNYKIDTFWTYRYLFLRMERVEHITDVARNVMNVDDIEDLTNL